MTGGVVDGGTAQDRPHHQMHEEVNVTRSASAAGPSRLGFFWHWFGRPLRPLPKGKMHRGERGGLLAISWLGTQTIIFWGDGAQLAAERLGGGTGG